MTPNWRIRTADGSDVDAGGRILSVAVNDEEGWRSDSAEIVLDDRDGAVEIPPSGVALSIELGYEEQGLRLIGSYAAGEVKSHGPPARLGIRATGIDMLGDLKERRTRSWDSSTVGSIGAAIAAEHGLDARIAPAAKATPEAHVDQAGESDMALLLRLCRESGLECKIQPGRLVIAQAGAGTSQSGRDMEAVDIPPGACGNYRIQWRKRSKWASVQARWRDIQSARIRTATAGSGQPAYEIRDLHATEALAQAAADARWAELARSTARLSLELPVADSRLVAESRIRLTGWRAGIPVAWRVIRARHRLDRRAYTCQIEAQPAAA